MQPCWALEYELLDLFRVVVSPVQQRVAANRLGEPGETGAGSFVGCTKCDNEGNGVRVMVHPTILQAHL